MTDAMLIGLYVSAACLWALFSHFWSKGGATVGEERRHFLLKIAMFFELALCVNVAVIILATFEIVGRY